MRTSIFALAMAIGAQPVLADAQALPVDAPKVDATTNDTIVVTASKIGNLQKAPVSGISLSSETLEHLNVQSVRDAQISMPSVVYDTSGGSAQVYIRGIGTNSAYAGLESSIGTYQDGVYLQRQVGAALDVVDLASIEVLNGPQGSLYGRNATGGVILVTTKNPVDHVEGEVSAGYSSFDTVTTDAVINLPITKDIAVRVAGKYASSDGYVTNLANGDKLGGYQNGTVRAKLGYNPAGPFSAVLAAEYSRQDSDPVARRLLVGAPECTACAVYGQAGSASAPFYQVNQTPTADTLIRYTAETLNLRYVADKFSVISVTGYRDFNYSVNVDQDYAAGDLFRTRADEYGATFTQDIYVRSKLPGIFNVLIGASGEIDHDSLLGQFFGAAFGPLQGGTSVSKVDLNSISPYGEVYVTPTSRLKLTLGARYNIDQKKLYATNDATTQLTLGATPSFNEKVTFRNFTPRAVLSYDLDAGTVYASISKGAKSGGYNTPALSPLVPLQPEKLTSYEVGAKLAFLDHRLSFQTAAFYYDYKNLQVSFVDASNGGVTAENAANARVYGLELNGSARPTKHLTLNAGATLLDAKFKSYQSAAIFCPAAAPSPGYAGCPAPTEGLGLASGVADLSNAHLPRAPNLSYVASADYTFAVNSKYNATFTIADRYTGRYDFLAGGGGPLGLSRQQAYSMVTASATIEQRPTGLKLRVYVENLAGAKYYLDLPTSSFGVAGSVAPPRSYGFSAGVNF